MKIFLAGGVQPSCIFVTKVVFHLGSFYGRGSEIDCRKIVARRLIPLVCVEFFFLILGKDGGSGGGGVGFESREYSSSVQG